MSHVQAEIITVGNELLYGQVVDKNATFISNQLFRAGFIVVQITTVADDVTAIVQALEAAQQRGTQLIITTGGLGPTCDDVTWEALSKYFSCSDINAIQHASAVSVSSTITSISKNQDVLTCTPILNPVGTALGIGCKRREGPFVIALPGVPMEMQAMLQETVIPYLKSQFVLPAIYHKTICTIGIAEEKLAAILSDWEKKLPSYVQLAYLPDVGTVKIRLITVLGTVEEAKSAVEEEIHKMLPLIRTYVYGYDEDLIEVVVGKLLQAHNKSLAIAESCSGGYASQLVVEVPGSSAYYYGGIVAYNNRVKHEVLGIPADTLSHYGAVSQEVALAMAQQVRLRLKADIGLSSTGIAGPGGGDVTNPVGTVWIAYADEYTSYARKLQLTNNRFYNIHLTAYALLDLLRVSLQRNK